MSLPDEKTKQQVPKGKLTVRVQGKERSVSVKELKAAVEKVCSRCFDFTAGYADVSVGKCDPMKVTRPLLSG